MCPSAGMRHCLTLLRRHLTLLLRLRCSFWSHIVIGSPRAQLAYPAQHPEPQSPRHRSLGYLHRKLTCVAHQASSRLHQPHLDRLQAPTLGLLRQRQPAEEVRRETLTSPLLRRLRGRAALI
jgi:hypothetical protein